MAVKVAGGEEGSLVFDAVINLAPFDAAADSMNARLRQIAESQLRQQSAANAAQQQYANLIQASGNAFKNLDNGVQTQISQLSNLQVSLKQIVDARRTLDQRFNDGVIGVNTYTGSLSTLIAAERAVTTEINKVSADLSANEAIMKATNGSIVQKTLELQRLKQAYLNLSGADRQGDIGNNMLLQIRGLDAEVRNVGNSFSQIEKAAVGSINERTLALQKLKNEYAGLSAIDRNNANIGGAMLKNIHAVDAEVKSLNSSFTAVAKNAAGSINEKVAALGRLRDAYNALAQSDRTGEVGRKMLQNMRELDREVQKVNRGFNETENLARRVTTALGAYASLSAGTNFLKDIVRVRGEFQQLEVALRVMLKSKEKADDLMAQAVTLAAKTPFTLQDVGTGAKQLLAYGFAADTIIGNLKTLGNVASGVGAPLGDIVYLYGTLRTQGRAYTRDIMQFTSRGIPIIEELSKVMKVNASEVAGLVEAGKVGFPEVERAFQNMTGAGGQFFNLMNEQSKTLTGLTSNLQDEWEKMLNSIGAGNEGLFVGGIKGATELIKNYESIIEVVKTLVIIYGSYRAALLINIALTKLAAFNTSTWTAAEVLHFASMKASAAGMTALNAAMAASPTIALTAAVAALVGVTYALSKTTTSASIAAEAMAEIRVTSAKAVAEEKVNLDQLQGILKSDLATREEKLIAVRKLREATGDTLKQLEDEQILLGEAVPKLDNYIEALGRRAKAEAALAEIKRLTNKQAELDIKGIDALTKFEEFGEEVKSLFGAGDYSKVGYFNQLLFGKDLDNAIVQKKKREYAEAASQIGDAYVLEIKELLTKQFDITPGSDATQAKERTLAYIEEQIKLQKDLQSQNSKTSKEYLAYQGKINALEAERERITGKRGSKAEDSRKKDLQELLAQLADAEREARRSGLQKDESEIDRINKKYDELQEKAKKLSAGAGILTRIENARELETGNERQKQEAEEYKTNLDKQRDLFIQFEEYKKEVGIEKARELAGATVQGFDSYLDFLAASFTAVVNDQSIGGRIKADAIRKQFADATAQSQKQATDAQIEQYKRLFEETASFNERRLALERKYQKERDDIDANPLIENKEERKAAVTEMHEWEITELESSFARQSDLYKKLNTDILGYNRERIKKFLDDLKRIQKDGFFTDKDGKKHFLTPQMMQDLAGAINGVEDLYTGTNKTVIKAKEMAKEAAKIEAAFNALAAAVAPLNQELADALSQMGSMANIAGNAAASIGQFAAGDIAGGISSAATSITGIFQAFAKAKADSRAAVEEVARFQRMLFQGEIDINILYRDRERQQIALNKTRLNGILAESELLKKQKDQNAKDARDLMNRIANESFILSEKEKKKRGLGVGPLLGAFGMLVGSHKTVETEFASLAGKSYDELEKLFTSGRLTDKAKELFSQLQKLKQEGLDIDRLLEENKAKAAEIFTGTTADAISDSIIDGFRSGLRAPAEFANKFEDLLRGAVINALKFQQLEEPLRKFYEEFAAAAQSDGVLTDSEVAKLRENYNLIIGDAAKKFEELKKITNVDFQATGAGATGSNNMATAIRGVTEQTGNLIAGQFGGLRLTAIDILKQAAQNTGILQAIQSNTAFLISLDARIARIETFGVKVI